MHIEKWKVVSLSPQKAQFEYEGNSVHFLMVKTRAEDDGNGPDRRHERTNPA